MIDETAQQSTQPLEIPAESRLAVMKRIFSFRNISAVYIFIVLFIIFSLWVPQTFLSEYVWRSMIDSQAASALVAVGLVLPLAAGVFDLAVGAEVGLGAVLVAWLLENAGLSIPLAIAVSIVVGVVIGLVSGFLVVKIHIDSFIATLAMSSILAAVILWVSGGVQIVGLSTSFAGIANDQFLGLAYPVYIMLVIAAVVWYVLERSALGRRIYATGGNVEAARLAGVKTTVIVVWTLATCAALASLAGVLVSSGISTGDPTVGPAFLLPAFTAAFLGSTQFRAGRFNVWGTVLAVYVLATGIKGLQLAGGPVWIPDLFDGVALILAVGMARYEVTGRNLGSIGRRLRRGRPGHADQVTDTMSPSDSAIESSS